MTHYLCPACGQTSHSAAALNDLNAHCPYCGHDMRKAAPDCNSVTAKDLETSPLLGRKGKLSMKIIRNGQYITLPAPDSMPIGCFHCGSANDVIVVEGIHICRKCAEKIAKAVGR